MFLSDALSSLTPRFLKSPPQVDVDEHSEASEKYEIEAMPTFKFIKNGVVLDTITGADEASIEAAANQHK